MVTAQDYQIVFVDTPGIHRSNTLMNKRMMDTVRASASADVVLFLIDVLEPFGDEDAEAIDLVKKLNAPAIAVLNKVDKLADKTQLLALIEQLGALHAFAEFVPISAAKGTGVDTLVKEIVKAIAGGRGDVSGRSSDGSAFALSGGGNSARKDSASHPAGSAARDCRDDRFLGGNCPIC